jgi:hypothetical protein
MGLIGHTGMILQRLRRKQGSSGSGIRYVLHPFAAKYSHWMWALSNSVRHKSGMSNSSARLVIRHRRKAVNKRSQRSSQVLSGEHSVCIVHACPAPKRAEWPDSQRVFGKDGDTLACSAIHRAKHQGCGTRDTLCMIWATLGVM